MAKTHTYIELGFYHPLFYYRTFILGFFTPPVSDNTEANMRADKFGRKPLTGIIRMEMEVEEREGEGGQDERRRRVEAE